MRTLSALVMTSLFAFVVAGCGSDPGSGSKTLFVKALAESDGSTDGTFLAVEVRQGTSDGELISDAVVNIVGDDTGEFNLPWNGGNFFGYKFGSYSKQLTWDKGWKLSVKRGQDELDAYLVAPGVTTITEPIAGTTFRRGAGEPLTVKWKDGFDRRADNVEVDFDDAQGQADKAFTQEDPLEAEVQANTLVATDKEKVRVIRRNEINLEGGVPGSTFRAVTHHRIEFAVE